MLHLYALSNVWIGVHRVPRWLARLPRLPLYFQDWRRYTKSATLIILDENFLH